MSVLEPPDERELPPLNEEQRRVLIDAMTRWVDRHPEPDRPFFGFAGGAFVSPRELVVAVREDSSVGRQYLESVRLVLTKVPFETFIGSIERSGRPRWRVLQAVLEVASAWSRKRRAQRVPSISRH